MTICINKKGSSVPVYSNYGLTTWGSKVGTVNSNELFVFYGTFTEANGAVSIGFYSPSGWRQGYVKPSAATGAFLTKAYIAKYGTSAHGGIAFKVLHRQSRIFSGTNVITTVKPGGKIITDGYSSSGSSYPYRLSIKGYIHAGSTKYHKVTNGWCDTDLEIGKSMYNTVTIDGKWVWKRKS